jgi:EmrB/QacA subfamily drug resistance transporter
LVATILGSSLAFIDSTVVNVALPVLQKDLQATLVEVQWVVEAYALFLSSLILAGGSLGDRFGRKRIFSFGIIIFASASVLCGFSPGIRMLIFARAIQGLGSALLIPGSLALISASFEDKERGKAIGTWSGFTAITTAIGPLLGGWLVEYAHWRWIFFINVPLAVIILSILYSRVPESRGAEEKGKIDLRGALLATFGLGGIVYGLIGTGTSGFTQPQIIAALLIGALSFLAFLLVEARSASPMLPLRLFRSPAFSGSNLLTFLLYAALGGTLFFVPFNLIGVQGYSPTAAGAANLPLILILFLLSRWSGGLVARFGPTFPLTLGPLVAAGGFALFALPGIGGSYWRTFFPAFVVLGIGMAISVAPLTTTVMESVDTQHAGIASGINNAVARTAGLVAIAVLGIVILVFFKARLSAQLNALSLPAEMRTSLLTQQNKLLDVRLPLGASPSQVVAIKKAIAVSFIDGFRLLMGISAIMAALSALCAPCLIRGKPRSREP